MKWFFKNEKHIESRVRILFEPESIVLTGFLFLVKDSELPSLITQVLLSKGFSKENTSILFFNEMDWEDKEGLDISEGEMSVYLYDGKQNEIVIKESLFDKILYDYSREVMKAHQNEKTISDTWASEMLKGMGSLEKKINQYSS